MNDRTKRRAMYHSRPRRERKPIEMIDVPHTMMAWIASAQQEWREQGRPVGRNFDLVPALATIPVSAQRISR